MYDLTLDSSELEWEPLDFPGVSMKTLRFNSETGAMSVLTRMEPGAIIPRHHHTNADETVIVLDGDFIEDGISHGPGTFFADPKGSSHGPHSTTRGCTIATTFSATLNFVLDN